jgi:curved DNA-binding protein CbpA|tara:strand:+ start:1662 stop:2597 length:936 start_codon:yes stop_codon:yes gene_type:complete
MNNFDPYEIFGLTKKFTLEELKQNFKKVAKRVHPDRGGDEKLFKLVTLAYQQLLEIYKLKQINKEFNELKSGFNEYSSNQDNQQRKNRDLYNHSNKPIHQTKRSNRKSSTSREQNLNSNFTDVFNKIYDDNKINDPYDNGYGDLMTEPDSSRPDIDIKRTIKNMKNFNQTFDSTPISKSNKKIIKYKDPIALPSSIKTLQYTEIGIDNIKDFSTESSDLSCVDYKKAYSTSKLIDKNYVRERTGYNDISGLEAERSNVNYNMSENDLKKEAYLKKKEQLKELKRLERIQQMDMKYEESFNNINNLMVDYKR